VVTYFRHYLFNPEGHIQSAEVISAESEEEAVAVSEAIYDLCSDTCSGFELRSGTTRVAARFGKARDGKFLNERNEKYHRAIVDFEEVLMASYAAIRQNKRFTGKMKTR
jgi:hypothetical protein